MGQKKNKRKKNKKLQDYIKALREPTKIRSGVRPSVVHRDDKKYNRKEKYKKKY
jgi:hypothetical protein